MFDKKFLLMEKYKERKRHGQGEKQGGREGEGAEKVPFSIYARIERPFFGWWLPGLTVRYFLNHLRSALQK